MRNLDLESGNGKAGLDEKLRQAYFWIVNNAIITPYYDLEFNDVPPPTFKFGGIGTEVRLPILSETFGIMVYQEQIIEIAVKLAGYSAAQKAVKDGVVFLFVYE